MQDEIAIDIEELTKLIVICPAPHCGTEIGFDLTNNQVIRRITCPVCNEDVLEMRRQQGFEFTWVQLFKMILNGEGRPRMIFRISRPAKTAEPNPDNRPTG